MSIRTKFCGRRRVVRGGLGVRCAGTGTFGVLSSALGACMRVRAPCATKTTAPLVEQVAQLPVGA